MAFFPIEIRQTLSRRTPREQVKCPVCKGDAERERNGDWQCIENKRMGDGIFAYNLLTCGARGISLKDELVVLWKPRTNED